MWNSLPLRPDHVHGQQGLSCGWMTCQKTSPKHLSWRRSLAGVGNLKKYGLKRGIMGCNGDINQQQGITIFFGYLMILGSKFQRGFVIIPCSLVPLTSMVTNGQDRVRAFFGGGDLMVTMGFEQLFFQANSSTSPKLPKRVGRTLESCKRKPSKLKLGWFPHASRCYFSRFSENWHGSMAPAHPRDEMEHVRISPVTWGQGGWPVRPMAFPMGFVHPWFISWLWEPMEPLKIAPYHG